MALGTKHKYAEYWISFAFVKCLQFQWQIHIHVYDPADCKTRSTDGTLYLRKAMTCSRSHSKEVEGLELKPLTATCQVSLKLNHKRDNQGPKKDGSRAVNSLNGNLGTLKYKITLTKKTTHQCRAEKTKWRWRVLMSRDFRVQ